MELDGWADPGERAWFHLRGPDAERYLNGQTTQDIRRCRMDLALPSLVTNIKGKIEAGIQVSRHPEGDGFLLDAPGELREALLLRLDRYLIADDAELADVTGAFRLFHALGFVPEAPEGTFLRQADRYGVAGTDWLIPSHLALDTPAPLLPPELCEALRIAHGIPRWGAEFGPEPEFFPQELRQEDRAVDFHKGCYIGQEVISRIKSAGKVNRLLRALVATEEDAAITPGEPLFLGEKEVGRITSTAKNPVLGRITALACVKRDAASEGTVLRVGPPEKKLSSHLEIRKTPLC